MHRLLLVAFALIVSGCSSDQTQAPQPDEVSPIDQFEGPSAEVEIVFDDLSMPHIYAQNDLDLFYAAGYQQASDRLVSLDMLRRAALGTQSEILGPDRLDGDIQARVIGFPRLADESLAYLRENETADYNLVIAYTAGVNRFVDEVLSGDAPRPAFYDTYDFDPEPFEPRHFIAHAMRIQFGFSSTLEFDLLNSLVGVLAQNADEVSVHRPVSETYIVESPVTGRVEQPLGPEPAEPARPTVEIDDAELTAFLHALRRFSHNLGHGEGSNGWTISGAHTFNGKPILANDSHARYYEPNAMYVMHLNSLDGEGSFDVTGLGFGGVPGVQVGHNRHIAWGATTAFADCTDLWDVAVSDGVVTYGDQSIELVTSDETIRVRQEDGTITEETVTTERVPGVGVLLPQALLPVPGALLARGRILLGWPGFDQPNSDLSVFLDFGRATSVDEFRQAVNRQITGMQNWHVVSATSMGYQTGSLVPDRGPVDGRPRSSVIMDGSDPTTTWDGSYLDRSLLPAAYGTRDYIASANNDPLGHTADGDPHNDPFYFGAFFAPHYRAGYLDARLRELTSQGEVTVDQNRALQMSAHSAAADRFLALLGPAVDQLDEAPSLADFRERSDDVAAAWNLLETWDRQMLRDATAPSLFRIFVAVLGANVLADDMGLLFDAIAVEQPVFVSKFTLLALERGAPGLLGGPREPLLVQSLLEAWDIFQERGEPAWRDTLRAEWLKPDQTKTYRAVDGGDSTLAVAQCRFQDGSELTEFCTTRSGAVWRYVAWFDDDDRPQMVFTTPETETGSTEDWLEGNHRPMRFDRDEVESVATARYTLR